LDDFYLIAEVIGIHDIDGSVIIKSYSDFSERFFELEEVIIDFFGKSKKLKIEFAKEVDGEFIIKFLRFNTEEDVTFLLGKKLYVDKANLFKLPNNTFYIHDLIGSEVYLGNLFFGNLVDVLNLPNNDIYLIQKTDGKEVMLPAIEKYIGSFNLELKRLDLASEAKIFEDYNED
jgi:16S rRNA processing protein RimM